MSEHCIADRISKQVRTYKKSPGPYPNKWVFNRHLNCTRQPDCFSLVDKEFHTCGPSTAKLVTSETIRHSTLKWQRQSGLTIFIYSPCDRSGALCLVMLHRASRVPSSDRSWNTPTLCITACQTPIFKGYRECRMLLHELFAKLHNANITQSSFLRISTGYRACCVAVTYMIAVLCYKAVKLQQPSYLTGLLSSYRQSRVLRLSTSDPLSTKSSLTNTAACWISCCALTVWKSSFICTHCWQFH